MKKIFADSIDILSDSDNPPRGITHVDTTMTVPELIVFQCPCCGSACWSGCPTLRVAREMAQERASKK